MKKKSRFFKVLCSLLVCCFGILGVGCGNDSDYANSLKDRYENGEMSYEEYLEERANAQSIPLYGTKVLYRPDNYNWDSSVGDGNQEYYGQYAWWLLNQLMAVYGIADEASATNVNDDSKAKGIIPSDQNKKSGFYDSIRYQMQSYNNVTLKKVKIESDGTKDVDKPLQTANFIELTADPTKNWNWKFGLETTKNIGTVEAPQFIKNTTYLSNMNKDDINYPTISVGKEKYPTPSISSNPIMNYLITGTDFINETIPNYYTDTTNTYSQIYLGTLYGTIDGYLAQTDSNNHSDYVKALEYALYCFNLDLTPNAMTVSYTTDENGVSGVPVVSIAGYTATADKSSVDLALETIKEVFAKRGTYVGVTEKQQQRLINWIKQNIIGTNSDTSFKITQADKTMVQYVTMKEVGYDVNGDGNIDANDKVEVMCDANGNETNTFAPITIKTENETTIEVERKYDETVSAIVDICTTQVNIGRSSSESEPDNDDPLHIDKKYLASNVLDYYGNDFYVSGNNEFPIGPNGVPEALEYQSILLMANPPESKPTISFSNILLFFQYDGSDDIEGNEEMTINIYMNYYTHSNKYYRPAFVVEDGQIYNEFQMVVKDTGFSYGAKDNTLMLFGINAYTDATEKEYAGITLNEWDINYKGGILNSILDGYTGLTSVGTPIPLTGLSDLRNYYQMKNDSYEEDNKTYTYTYGVFDHEYFDRDDEGSDFFEIAFEVVKVTTENGTTSDEYNNKNYKFQVGFGTIA